jgi:carboxypeptidase C (cathepsin A)
MGSGFSYAPFPSVDSTFDSAKQTYDFLQSFFKAFPEYTSNPLAVNSLSYGGHYAPVYSSYIQHMNAQLDDESSLWTDIWPTDVPRKTDLRLNLTSLSVGNGWINGRKQYRSLVDFACSDEIPIPADKNDCKWARDKVAEAEILLDTCSTKLEWYVALNKLV